MEIYQLPKVLKLDYKTWRCGGSHSTNKLGEGPTELFNSSGYMCCLGQFSCQAGVDKDYLFGMGEPADTECVISDLSYNDEPWGTHDTLLSSRAIDINDSMDTTVAEKVVALRKLFGEKGYTIELINFPQDIIDEINTLN